MASISPMQATERMTPAFRIDVPLHNLLVNSGERAHQRPGDEPVGLPDPVFPQRPDSANDADFQAGYSRRNAIRTARCWGPPYAKSLWHRSELRPIIAYLFTEYKCNRDCHYCWSFNNTIKGMAEPIARRSVDWLHSMGNRVLALMGGEPLLRPDFMHKIIDYAAKKEFFVYLPTNGRLMKPGVVDRLGDAGLAAVNLAVDCVNEKPGLPKALNAIRPYFEYLVKNQKRYGCLVMLNINITRINMDDVKELIEIARDNGIGTDYHINEAPMLEQNHFKHFDENDTYLRPADYSKVDDLLDYLADKHRQGYKMPNPGQHMAQMKQLMRGRVDPWPCRAGQNMLIIRTDGTLAPCFPMYSATYDWGVVGDQKFDVRQLDEMKNKCSQHCLSTCNYILAYCYNAKRVIHWGLKQALRGFRGASGSF
jgi:MoaA/NifB/PqqE/SkfB family radical SAM enzyme